MGTKLCTLIAKLEITVQERYILYINICTEKSCALFDYVGLLHSPIIIIIIKFSQSGEVHHVSQFHITNWAPDGSISNIKTVTDVIDEVIKVQIRTSNKPILIHCRFFNCEYE